MCLQDIFREEDVHVVKLAPEDIFACLLLILELTLLAVVACSVEREDVLAKERAANLGVVKAMHVCSEVLND
jgi:hypothetical protein